MGVKHFFPWLRTHFSECIQNIRNTEKLRKYSVEVDNLCLDLNGIFHTCAQIIYKYGNHKEQRSLLRPRGSITLQDQLRTFQCVCARIDELFAMVQPSKRLILCVDGIAGAGKLAQQRQRRFRSAKEREDTNTAKGTKVFDSNCITPGSEFMHYLTKYIDWYIRKNMTYNPMWKNVEVILSNEKVPGEGEHKIINYIRRYGKNGESYCIHGADADLIMLALGTHVPNFYILREDHYRPDLLYVLNIGLLSLLLSTKLAWKGDRVFKPSNSIDDFIFMCFMVGNDFVPQIPTLEIMEGGIDMMLDVYKNVCSEYGHLTIKRQGLLRFNKKVLEVFLGTITQYEQGTIEAKLNKKESFFPDALLEKHTTVGTDGYHVKLEEYRSAYYAEKLNGANIKALCHNYLEGLQWVLSYYTSGISSWTWFYEFHYAPYPRELTKHIKTFRFPVYSPSRPLLPFQQLLAVLPPQSAPLIPSPLRDLVTEENSPIREFYPKEFHVDLSGKRREWEGIVILPFVNFALLKSAYLSKVDGVSEQVNKRNIVGKSFIYSYSDSSNYVFRSYYGHIPNCKVRTTPLEL